MEGVKKILHQAEVSASERGLDVYLKSINHELTAIEDTYKEWELLIAKNATIGELLRKAEIDSYIHDVLKITGRA